MGSGSKSDEVVLLLVLLSSVLVQTLLDVVLPPVHFQPFSICSQLLLHPSPLITFPSSQTSVPTTFSSPHISFQVFGLVTSVPEYPVGQLLVIWYGELPTVCV